MSPLRGHFCAKMVAVDLLVARDSREGDEEIGIETGHYRTARRAAIKCSEGRGVQL